MSVMKSRTVYQTPIQSATCPQTPAYRANLMKTVRICGRLMGIVTLVQGVFAINAPMKPTAGRIIWENATKPPQIARRVTWMNNAFIFSAKKALGTAV